jgi:aminoglycoside phosphotransferase (APT) family kinase protein
VDLLASGRDCDVFDLGDGTVLRRQRKGRSLEHEAEVMRHVRALGYPCPEVHRAEGTDLVMDRIDGPTMLADLLADLSVDRAVAAGATLGGLHQRLHELPALEGHGTQLHLDLHPDNVMLTGAGPTVIDWSNATGGDPAFDLAMTWLIIVPFLGLGLPEVSALLDSFLEAVDIERARSGLAQAARRRFADPNLLDHERVAVQAMLDEEGVIL